MIFTILNASTVAHVQDSERSSRRDRQASPMRADLRAVGSAEFAARREAELRLMVQEGRYPIPIWDPSKSRYDPHARSSVTHGTSASHYSTNPYLSAQRFAACASPSLRQDPDSEWSKHVEACKEYLRLSSPEPPRRVAPVTQKQSGCCTLL